MVTGNGLIIPKYNSEYTFVSNDLILLGNKRPWQLVALRPQGRKQTMRGDRRTPFKGGDRKTPSRGTADHD
jgi:hypothetical protein